MNIWEGNEFPKNNLLKDGFLGMLFPRKQSRFSSNYIIYSPLIGPAPVTHYEPNDYGLYNMLGKHSTLNL